MGLFPARIKRQEDTSILSPRSFNSTWVLDGSSNLSRKAFAPELPSNTLPPLRTLSTSSKKKMKFEPFSLGFFLRARTIASVIREGLSNCLRFSIALPAEYEPLPPYINSSVRSSLRKDSFTRGSPTTSAYFSAKCVFPVPGSPRKYITGFLES